MTGESHAVIILKNGTIKVAGANYAGQLGLGDEVDRNIFTLVPGITGVKDVACGSEHTTLLMDDGTLMTCGDAGYGALGLGSGNLSDRTLFEVVAGISGVKQVSANYNTTIILMNNGKLYGTGMNSAGELGLGDNVFRYEFTEVEGIVGDIKEISSGSLHNVLLMTNGTIQSVGYNPDGQLGLGDFINRNVYETVLGISGVKKVITGNRGYHTILWMNDDTVKVCGSNFAGELGLGDNAKRSTFTVNPAITGMKHIFAGSYITGFILEDGTVKICGEEYALGCGAVSNSNIFLEPSGVGSAVLGASGQCFVLLLMEDGSVMSCGGNYVGELGVGDDNRREFFTPAIGF